MSRDTRSLWEKSAHTAGAPRLGRVRETASRNGLRKRVHSIKLEPIQSKLGPNDKAQRLRLLLSSSPEQPHGAHCVALCHRTSLIAACKSTTVTRTPDT